ncbi:Response regulator of zinc sigma-54-dependent two-component system [hydrothermal vent metagenome]|uniref:Response regulator of zinc sigma-54-dependent two-component system n=1 Tax=hydrothermal vent metagenome TaxID=652676 RepID=A0A3B1DF11_9ZZZZ
MENRIKLLIVDDEKIAIKNLEHVLNKEGYEIKTTSNGQNALKLLSRHEFDVVLTDLKMEKVDGMQILKRCKESNPDLEVIMITGYATVETAIAAMKHGAYHYIAKPFNLDEVKKVVREASEKVRLKKENRQLRESLENITDRVRIITQDPRMLRVLDTARDVAPTDCNILITGESGTGKELVARYVHLYSRRSEGPFIAINCGAFSEGLLVNELFGHEKGAFTGATFLKKGLIEVASKGTLFLDEITEMSPSMQVKLLRVVQEREYQRVGGTEPVKVDVRFIAATNRTIQEVIESGEFRQDLYYRLNVVTLHLPPLSERKGDIPLLCYHFLKKYSSIMGKDVSDISEDMLGVLNSYNFPGNVRELENIIERGIALSKGKTLETIHLPDNLRELSIRTFRKRGGKVPSLEDQEKAYIQWVLKEFGGNKSKAAQVLGIDRVSLWRKIKRYDMEK